MNVNTAFPQRADLRGDTSIPEIVSRLTGNIGALCEYLLPNGRRDGAEWRVGSTQAWLIERAAMREDSGTTRVDANKLAFDELLWLWHAANPVEHTPGRCAACGTAFEPPVMSLPDGAQVCDGPDHDCLIAYGSDRRIDAVKALKSLGIVPPAWWEL